MSRYNPIDHPDYHEEEDIARRVTPMPDIPDPHRHQSFHEDTSYNARLYSDPRYDYDHGAEEQHQGHYFNEPYQSAPQDVPLLGMPSQGQHEHLYDPHPDPFRDPSIHNQPSLHHRQSYSSVNQPPVLQHQESSTTLGGASDAGGHTSSVKRSKTVKPIPLWNGNLVLDCPVPPKILSAFSAKDREFTHMRYTAATCDPADFKKKHFSLRQNLFQTPRRTELFIVVTMYNEEDDLFARTMAGIWQNIEFMCNGKKNGGGSWGVDGWKKIVVCVVSDGRAKINPRTKGVLTALGCYQEGIAKQMVNEDAVTAHLYENTTKVGIDIKNDVVVTTPGGSCPVQVLFCLKELNQKKINSHRWAIQAFGDVLQPNICVLLDAGTRPGKDSIYYLWRAFDVNQNCGGACGEIKAMTGKGGKLLLNPLIATQNFEYKMSNILDKPMESAFGFISVLPGAFSAYRYIALQNNAAGQGPLEKYFAGEKMHATAGIFAANMYLAEDRILCFELVSKRNASWVLTYVKNATGETDVPDNMRELILQRRRWLNGSFFAAVYALAHFYEIFRSSHSMVRKIAFLVEFVFQTVSMIFSWFAIGNFFLVFQILTSALGEKDLLGRVGVYAGIGMQWLYVATLVTCFVLSLGNRPQASGLFYMSMVYFWTFIMVYLTFASVFITIKSIQHQLADGVFTWSEVFTNSVFFTLIVSLLSTYVLWIFVSCLFGDAWHIVTSTLQYIMLTPTYCNVINVYAFCNTHDITWGTKGDDKPPPDLPTSKTGKDGKIDADVNIAPDDLDILYEQGKKLFDSKAPEEIKKPNEKDVQDDYYKGFRSAVVLVWMFCNAVLIAVVLKSGGLSRLSVARSDEDEDKRKTQVVGIYLKVLLWSVAGLSGFKFIGAMYFLFGYWAQKGLKIRFMN